MQCPGSAQCPAEPSSPGTGPRLVHGSSEKGIPKDSAAILLCVNPQGLFHFSVSSRLSETNKFHDENGIVPGSSFSKAVFVNLLRLLIYEHLVLPVSV